MNTPILSDIKVLDNLLALNLNVNLWSARKKMALEDFGGAELPPEDLASLGSKRIADPNSLKVFVTLKARAFNYLDRHGIRFMSGWAIPEDKAGDIIKELIGIRDEFLKEKDAFLTDYDQSIENWINKHTKWASIIRESTVGSEYVRSRMGFSWQLYRVAPLMDHAVPEAVAESGLNEEVENLAKTLFGEIAFCGRDMESRLRGQNGSDPQGSLPPADTPAEAVRPDVHQSACKSRGGYHSDGLQPDSQEGQYHRCRFGHVAGTGVSAP